MISTVSTACRNLKKILPWKVNFRQGENSEDKIIFYFEREGVAFDLIAEVMNEIRHPGAISLNGDKGNKLFIANYISPQTKSYFHDHHINYLETSGNCFINVGEISIFVAGEKQNAFRRRRRSPLFQFSGIKLIFLFLVDPELVNANYRELSTLSTVATGSIGKILGELKEKGFLAKLTSEESQLIRRKELLDLWTSNYGGIMREKQKVGQFRFIQPGYQWNKIKTQDWENVWGGEPGGDLLTNYLEPETYTIYSSTGIAALAKEFKIVPDQEGIVEVLTPFWNKSHIIFRTYEKTVHPVLIYADLMLSNNGRNIETANRIYEEYLPYLHS